MIIFPFFDTIEDGPGSVFGQYKNDEVLTYSKAKTLKEGKRVIDPARGEDVGAGVDRAARALEDYTALIPEEVREYAENYDYVRLYQKWVTGKLRLGCHSIMDSAIVLPDGDVPLCQHLPTRLGNAISGGSGCRVQFGGEREGAAASFAELQSMLGGLSPEV